MSSKLVADPEEIQYQQYLISLISKRWQEDYLDEKVTSGSYFGVLHELMDILAFDRIGMFLRTVIRSAYRLPPSMVDERKRKRIEALQVHKRRELLILAKRIIEDWPSTFGALEILIKGLNPYMVEDEEIRILPMRQSVRTTIEG